VRLHPWAIVQDRWNDEAMLVGVEASNHEISYRIERLLNEEPDSPAAPLTLSQPFRSDWDFADYERRFAAVQRYIVDGDCYQINLGQRFEAPYSGSVHAAYRSLRDVAKAPFSALVPLDSQAALLCVSPERFLTVDGTRVSTHPIKGTRPRSSDPAEDQGLAEELLNSAKERAENLMIVDLLRNDIGRFCTAGSVFVEELFTVESYATVHHLVSHVRATLGGDTSPLALLLGCMPGGSITGAPKHRAMQLIDELEGAPRESWCGTVFYRCARGRLDSNILIRTVHADGKKLSCWAGGGLVADSQVKDEYQELEHKVGALLRALEKPLASG
jgi:para-aminobenzoate synthetase component 1